MKTMRSFTYFVLLLSTILLIIAEISAIPGYDDDYYQDYQRQPRAKQPDSLIDNLKSGYYYIDNGSITPIERTTSNVGPPSGQRRYDYYGNDVKYIPIVRYKQTHAKRKKLFVPNFFG